ncbi:LysM peptidoglycan-binding domain-containing protein [Fontisphaera persica]|uniref:LysM peptidoglycan-binding domain-containing protein n=1 Tax=Fontisphaera persica TaxID=2974023 RepID=UPI0024C00228|nr:LysM peptidoglycan-binding domain-containing protein [Fontisphaera persica]WCJ58569.1 LysM peptidoglycan-binding domain-containing protein [Fontisphaera persica]
MCARLRSWFRRAWPLFLLAVAGGWGCFPPTDSALDEAKEPYYVLGLRKLGSFDYKGAVEAFEKAVEANPRSASAHFQLGVLYEQKIAEENSYAIAIYHYNKFLQLRPRSAHAEIVKQRIIACKQELAKPIALAPGAQSVLRDIERLKVENAQLRSQLEAWVAYATNRAALAPPPVAPSPMPPGTSTPAATNPPTTVSHPLAPSPSVATNRPSAMRTHKVQANETPAAIARKYGISLRALMDANPGVDARRLKIGQVLNIPPS